MAEIDNFTQSIIEDVAGKTDGQEPEVENTFDDTATLTNLVRKNEKEDPMGGVQPNTSAAESYEFSIEEMDNQFTANAGIDSEAEAPTIATDAPVEELVAEVNNSDDTAVDPVDTKVLLEGAVTNDEKVDLSQVQENYENYIGYSPSKRGLESFIRESEDGTAGADEVVDTSDITNNLPKAEQPTDGSSMAEPGEEPIAENPTMDDVTPTATEEPTEGVNEPGEESTTEGDEGGSEEESSESLYNYYNTISE